MFKPSYYPIVKKPLMVLSNKASDADILACLYERWLYNKYMPLQLNAIFTLMLETEATIPAETNTRQMFYASLIILRSRSALHLSREQRVYVAQFATIKLPQNAIALPTAEVF